MFLLLAYLFVLAYSQTWVDKSVSYSTTIYYNETAANSTDYYVNQTDNVMFKFSNEAPVTTYLLIVDFSSYDYSNQTASFIFSDTFDSTTLEYVNVQHNKITKYMLYMSQYTGYFQTRFYCPNSSNCSSPTNLEVYLTNSSSNIYIDDDYSNVGVYVEFQIDNSKNTNGYPYCYFGNVSHSLNFDFTFDYDIDYLNGLSGKYYLFTTRNSSISSNNSTTAKAVCSRQSISRYVMFNVNDEVFEDCSCWAKNNDTVITKDTVFNYPDCNFNGQAFDLILPSDSTDIYFGYDMNFWDSIIFGAPNQTIDIYGSELIVYNMLINQENLQFSCYVNMKNLTIMKPNAYFDYLYFDNIYIDEAVDIDAVLFKYYYKYYYFTTDLSEFGLFEVGVSGFQYNYIVYRGYVCEPNGTDYIETDFVTNNECNLQKKDESNGLVLELTSTEPYTVTENEYWNILSVSSDVVINGIGSIRANVCEFQYRSLTIDISLYCKKMRVSDDTTIVISSITDLTIDTLIVHSFYTNQLNSLKFITSAGKVTLSNIELDYSYSYVYDYENYCFDVISSNSIIEQPTITNGYSAMLLSQNRLLRVCPSNSPNTTVICKTDNKYDYVNFTNTNGDAACHCPCFNENCTIQIENNDFDLDLEGIEFNGIIEVKAANATIININYINEVNFNYTYPIYFEKDSSVDRMSIKSIDDGQLFIKGDCNIYSSIIPEITPLANVYLLNESVTMALVNIDDPSYIPITITSTVESIDVNEIYLNEYYNEYYNTIFDSIFLIEKSTEILIVKAIPIMSTPIPTKKLTEISTLKTISVMDSLNPFVLMKQQSRELDYVDEILCDNQAIIVNPSETICNVLNLYDHYCYSPISSNGYYYQSDYTTIDYSCPCNKSNSNCVIELDKNEIMTYDVDLPITTLIIHQSVTINPNNYDFNIQTSNVIDVTFNSVNDTVIYVNDESTQFTINTPLTGNLLLFSSLYKFSQSITKSATTIQTLQVSTDYYCNALSIENESNECLVCNAISNADGICINPYDEIDNCELQDGFGCEVCYEGYESYIENCITCPDNCLRCYNGECINCDTNYYVNSYECIVNDDDSILIYDNKKIMKCIDGYYSNFTSCIKCDDNCISCNSTGCLTCDENYTIAGLSCRYIEEINGEELVSNYGVIDCEKGYYLNDSQCKICSSIEIDNNCELCDVSGCLICLEGFALLNDGSCSSETQSTIKDSISISCYDSGSWFNGTECVKCGTNCNSCVNGQCIECEDDYILVRSNTCIYGTDIMPDYCLDLTIHGTCKRCEDGYYVNAYNLCEQCPDECTSCHNSTYCLECVDNYVINYYNECVDKTEELKNCYHSIPGSSGGCAVCKPGYYRLKTTCFECIDNCTTCHNDYECTICNDNYFVVTGLTECISYDELTNCDNKTASGCSECSDGYYLNGQYCYSCESKTSDCESCNKRNGECLTCSNNYVLADSECIHYQSIDYCEEAKDSKCTSCSFWHTPTHNGDGCETKAVWWVIVLVVLFFIFIFICIVAAATYAVNKYLNHRKFKKLEKQMLLLIKMKYFFNEQHQEIPVNEETRDIVCVGNKSKHTIKVQFSVKDGCDKYEVRTEPQLVAIPKGKACEFEIFIKPLCTCSIIDSVMLISTNLRKGKTITTPLSISTQTIMTTRLDYEELKEDKKLGEGSFGIVYKGMFRGNQVAIKKMKEASDDELSMNEFEKEVAMLDKFRCEYIVHFYGAVFIPDKICMVTELAQYGSLQDLMKKRKKEPISNTLKMKVTMDAAKGIQYLHSNGILHRDIKPDNLLVTSLEENVPVNAKLTDFGSSRNINILMNNKTFTKGIGSPAYMAPEVLKRSKYQATADIFSFAITMYETFDWQGAYPNTEYRFKFPWKIAEFVTKGERLEQTKNIGDGIYDLISNCWKHTPEERLQIDEIVEKLESIN
ncbi:Protein kinase domain containing protein [Entamoeba marina]